MNNKDFLQEQIARLAQNSEVVNTATSLLQDSPESSRLYNLPPLPLPLVPKLVWWDMQILNIALQKAGVLSTTSSLATSFTLSLRKFKVFD